MTTFGERLKEAIERKGLTQKKFSIMCNIKPYTINRYISNQRQPDLETLIKMAELLDISLTYLLLGQNASCPEKNFKEEAGIYEPLTADETNLLKIYRALNEKNKGKAELLWEQLLKRQQNKSTSN